MENRLMSEFGEPRFRERVCVSLASHLLCYDLCCSFDPCSRLLSDLTSCGFASISIRLIAHLHRATLSSTSRSVAVRRFTIRCWAVIRFLQNTHLRRWGSRIETLTDTQHVYKPSVQLSVHPSLSLPHNPFIFTVWLTYGCSSWVPYCLATTSSIFFCSTLTVSLSAGWLSNIQQLKHEDLSPFSGDWSCAVPVSVEIRGHRRLINTII